MGKFMEQSAQLGAFFYPLYCPSPRYLSMICMSCVWRYWREKGHNMECNVYVVTWQILKADYHWFMWHVNIVNLVYEKACFYLSFVIHDLWRNIILKDLKIKSIFYCRCILSVFGLVYLINKFSLSKLSLESYDNYTRSGNSRSESKDTDRLEWMKG